MTHSDRQAFFSVAAMTAILTLSACATSTSGDATLRSKDTLFPVGRV